MTGSKFLFFFLIICSFLRTQAQVPSKGLEQLVEKNKDYFELNRGNVFLHLNKTTLLADEALWFTAYAYYGKYQEPDRSTTNLHVNIYNNRGENLKSKIIFLNDGFGSGFFEFDSAEFPPGEYLIKAGTQYMKNFPEDLRYIQKFRIASPSGQGVGKRKYDLQLLPEGGHLLADTENTVAVKLIDNSGKGVRFSKAYLLDQEGKKLQLFKSNRFGLGKFEIVPKQGESYSISLVTEYGEELEADVSPPAKRSIGLTAKKTSFGGYTVTIKTTRELLPQVSGKNFILAVHQEGKMKAVEFQVPDTLQTTFNFTGNELFSGINIFTLFDEDLKPITERMIFNWDGILRRRVQGKFLGSRQDSLLLELSSREELGRNNLSISILPQGTKSYHPNHNILSAFYLKPFLRGEVEDGSYYFSQNISFRKRDRDLDLLLLTQGWSRYSWNDFFNTVPVEHYEHENGFEIRGQISKKYGKKEFSVAINSPASNLLEVVPVKENGSFKLDHAFIFDNSEISFSLFDRRKEQKTIDQLFHQIRPFKDTIDAPDLAFETVGLPEGNIQKNGRVPENFTSKAEELAPVFLKGETIEKEEEGRTTYLKNNSSTTKTVISEREENAFKYITDFLRFHGYKVIRGQASVYVLSSRANLQLKYRPEDLMPVITVNNVRLPQTINGIPDFSQLVYMRTTDVESIKINKSGAGLGFGGSAGWIDIQLRKGVKYQTEGNNPLNLYYATSGYAPQKEFYVPKYRSYTHSAFQNFGTIGWKPAVQLEKGETIKVFNTLQPKIELYIEGMTNDGYLISEVIELDTTKS